MLNLTPILRQDQPTSHVKVGRSKVGGSTDVVEITHNNRSAYFFVRAIEDSPLAADTIGNKVRMHRNVASLFGGIDQSSDFTVDPAVTVHEVVECDAVKIHAGGNDPDGLEAFLRETNYLLHPIEEVVATGDDDLAMFTPVDMQPSGYNTLRVVDETDIEFIDAGDLREYRATHEGGGGPVGAGDSQAADDETIEVNLEPTKPTVSFDEDVAGLPAVKRTARMLLALFDPDVRTEVEDRYGPSFAARGNSMLLYGPPGCGKTLISEAIAYEAKFNSNIEDDYGEVKFLEVRGSDVLSKYSGESEKRVRAVFEKAHGIAQGGFCVLFFDEVETLIPDRGDDSLQRHERSLTNAFLQEMNDVEDNLLVIGATNMPFTIDPAATRRFPIQQFIPQPDEAVMAEVWRKHLDSLSTADELDYETLGERSVGYTPAEVADRILGSEFQRELVESVMAGDPIVPDTEYLLAKLEDSEPKTVRQYVASVRDQTGNLEGYPELQRYVEAQVERLGLQSDAGSGALEALLNDGSRDRGSGSDPSNGAGGETPDGSPTRGSRDGDAVAGGGESHPPSGRGGSEGDGSTGDHGPDGSS